MSEYLASWTTEQEPKFEEFRIVAAEGDSRALQLREVIMRFSMPFGLYPSDSEEGQVCSRRRDSTQRASPW